MNIPPIADLEKAIYIFYRHAELSNKEIVELFGHRAKSTINNLKKVVKERMREEGVASLGLHTINTNIAYDTWGLNIEDLEHRRAKLQELKLAK